jgi:NadR type nicotinamide-nucleotide adenylyltransferase
MANPKTLKIAIVGPESSGKTELCKVLSSHFKRPWVAEYARKYFERFKPDHYDQELLVSLLCEQIRIESDISEKNSMVFCDTAPINFVVWSKFRFGDVHPEILNLFKTHTYWFTLVLKPDLSWVDDGIRINPDDRHEVFEAHCKYLTASAMPFGIVSGWGVSRLHSALNLLKSVLPANKSY